MPIIRSAKKKLKQDKKRTKINALYISAYRNALKKLKKQKGSGVVALREAYVRIDKALKKKVIHKKKANRLKSQAAKLARSFSSKKQVQSK